MEVRPMRRRRDLSRLERIDKSECRTGAVAESEKTCSKIRDSVSYKGMDAD